MLMSWVWVVLIGVSVAAAMITGHGAALSGAVMQGAQSGVNLAVSLAGALCLWSGVGRLMTAIGITNQLAHIFQPLLHWLFPSTKTDAQLAGTISTNFCANLLGLGNAATPPGIAAAKRMAHGQGTASDELCRFVVLNTASIQLIPSTVAAVRSALGCRTPFDLLPAVWCSSVCAAALGLAAAYLLEKIFADD